MNWDAMQVSELEAAWEDVPTAQQDAIQQCYAQLLEAKDITDDAGEADLIATYIERYVYEGLIPAGDKWLKINSAARERLHSGNTNEPSGAELPSRSSSRMLVGGGLILLVLGILLVINRMNVNDAESVTIALDATSTATATISPTPTQIPTTTPIALVDTDRYVNESDRRANSAVYPVILRIENPDNPARVFIVQEKQIASSEWHYDPNPDVASWLSGMRVHPVIGIPHETDNELLFKHFTDETDFVLRMNTGAELRFGFEVLRQHGREDSTFFAQRAPGISLVLLGQVDESGLPTETRLVAHGRYLAEREREQLDLRPPQNLIAPQIWAQVGALRVQVLDTHVSDEDFNVIVQIESDTTAHLNTYTWLLEDTNDSQFDLSRPLTALLQDGSNMTTALSFPRTLQSKALVVGIAGETLRFDLNTATATEDTPALDMLDVQLRHIERDSRTVSVALRLYNPTSEILQLTPQDIWLITGYVPNPNGQRRTAIDFNGIDIAPDSAWDVRYDFAWNGRDPFAAFGIAGRRYTINLEERAS